MTRSLTTAGLTTILIGALSAGCSGGSSGGGGGSFAGGGLSTALPVADRNVNGYSFSSTSVGSTPGSVSALGVAGTGTASLAAVEPGHQIVRLEGTGAVSEGSLVAEARGIAATTSGVYAATGQLGQPGAGELYVRLSSGAWQIALDTNHELLSVGTLNGQVVAAGGSPGSGSTIYAVSSSSLAPVATIASASASAVAGYRNAIYVGAGPADAVSGQASLWRVSGGAAESIAFPSAAAGATIREQVTALQVINTVSSANPTQSSYLVVATGAWDTASGEPVGGAVLVTDGDTVEVLASFTGEAPLCLAVADSTIYAGLSSGRLVFRANNGAWQDEAVTTNAGVHSLLPRAGQLLVGVAGAAPAVLTRTANAAPANPTPSTSPAPNPSTSPAPTSEQEVYFDPHIRIVLQTSCVSCHATALSPAYNAFPLSRLPDDQASFDSVLSKVDVSNPTSSLFLIKASGGMNHTGGALIQAGSPEYTLFLDWIRQGARLSVNASPFKTYLAHIRPILNRLNCGGCHVGRPFSLGGDSAANYQEVLQFAAAGDLDSEILQRNDGRLPHAGAAPWTSGPDRDTVVQWIQDGVLYR